MARRLGITNAALTHYEAGRSPLPFRHGNESCKILDVNQRWLARGAEPSDIYIPISEELDAAIPEKCTFLRAYENFLKDRITKDSDAFLLFTDSRTSVNPLSGFDGGILKHLLNVRADLVSPGIRAGFLRGINLSLEYLYALEEVAQKSGQLIKGEEVTKTRRKQIQSNLDRLTACKEKGQDKMIRNLLKSFEAYLGEAESENQPGEGRPAGGPDESMLP